MKTIAYKSIVLKREFRGNTNDKIEPVRKMGQKYDPCLPSGKSLY